MFMKKIGNYEMGGIIGEGSFSFVKCGMHLPTQSNVAVKLFNKKSMEPNSLTLTRFYREVNVFSKCDHPYIARYYDLLEDDNFLYLVQEFAPKGNLLESVNARGFLPEKDCRKYFCQMLSAVDYIHNEFHVVHRDLKAENILLDENDNVKLIDFGLCNILDDEKDFLLKTACGSPAYASPEIFRGEQYNQSSDIWSLGIILYAISCCQLPFEDNNVNRLLEKIVFTEPDYPMMFSSCLIDLLKKMLEKNPEKRITIQEIWDHPWVNRNNKSLYSYPNSGPKIEEQEVYDLMINMNIFDISYSNDHENVNNADKAAYRIIERKLLIQKMAQKKCVTLLTPTKILVKSVLKIALNNALPSTILMRRKSNSDAFRVKESEPLIRRNSLVPLQGK
ncbi:CAMK family protein kinase [Tritrichomonas foetus]|uniref:non-specific serine/threonine protein kinase n=1 Tax=Tritrichomonas foetus TaxID=1144522 RepID=A0A1J4KQE3_9EUKA|nr:CAMK family protein kinase [Tritrichomonas foetus]|eukprot:OHT13511.1 CAMK family protein kinase [Tritrichomonas foetus]